MTAVDYNRMLHTLDTLAGKISPGSNTSPGGTHVTSTGLDGNANRVHPYSKHVNNNNNNNNNTR